MEKSRDGCENYGGLAETRGFLKFDAESVVAVSAFHFPLFKEGLREIFGRHCVYAIQNPPQSSFKKEEVLPNVQFRDWQSNFNKPLVIPLIKTQANGNEF